jgi:hypothetical protein
LDPLEEAAEVRGDAKRTTLLPDSVSRCYSLAENYWARLGTPGELREVGFALLFVGVAAFLCLFAAVEE